MQNPQNLPGSWQRPTSSLQSYGGLDPIRLEALTTAAKRLFSQFRTDAAVDPKTYVTAVIAILAHYSPEIVMAVTHPFTGLASRQNWLPTIYEIRKACDQANAPPARGIHQALEETLERRRSTDVAEDASELRREHVARLRREGKLAYSASDGRDAGSWFNRMSVDDALAIQRKYEGEARTNDATV